MAAANGADSCPEQVIGCAAPAEVRQLRAIVKRMQEELAMLQVRVSEHNALLVSHTKTFSATLDRTLESTTKVERTSDELATKVDKIDLMLGQLKGYFDPPRPKRRAAARRTTR